MASGEPSTNLFRAPLGLVERSATGSASGRYAAGGDPFARDRFLLRQQHLAINEQYDVLDDQGEQLLFIERPSHIASTLIAAGVALAAFAVCAAAFFLMGTQASESTSTGFALFGLLIGAALAALIALAFVRRRDVTIYRDQGRAVPLLVIRQQSAVGLVVARYTVTDGQGTVIAEFRKNALWNLVRRRWQVRDAAGKAIYRVLEDSIILSLLRRILGSLFGILRTNFVILAPDGRLVGRLNRSFTLLDRYVLDLSFDPDRTLDRRLAVAIGVMLDSGERR